jgi:cell division protein FtsB
MKAVLVRIGYASAVILAAVYLVLTLTGPKGVAALVEKQRRIQAMEKRNAGIARDIELRQQRIQRLRGDQDEQDKVIEERFRYVRPGEKIFMLPGSETKAGAGGQGPGGVPAESAGRDSGAPAKGR